MIVKIVKIYLGLSLVLLWVLWVHYQMGFPHSSVGKESACNSGDPRSIPGSERSTGEGIGYPLQYSWASFVAQLIKNLPAIRETWVWSLGWEDPLEKGLPTPVFWPGEFHGLYSPWGHKESEKTEQLSLHFSMKYKPLISWRWNEKSGWVDVNTWALDWKHSSKYLALLRWSGETSCLPHTLYIWWIMQEFEKEPCWAAETVRSSTSKAASNSRQFDALHNPVWVRASIWQKCCGNIIVLRMTREWPLKHRKVKTGEILNRAEVWI